MTNEAKEKNTCVSDATPQTLILKEATPEKQNVICEICGHSNTSDKAMCTMCSNYLKGFRK